MTVFGFIWISILIIAMFYNIKYLFLLTILSSVFQCNNVLVIGNSGIGPQVITSIVFIFRVLMLRKHNLKIKIYKNFLPLEIACISLLFVALISLIVNNNLNENILRYFQLVVYVLCFIAMSKIASCIEEDFIYKCIRNISIFLVCVGFLQLLITTGIFPRLGIINTLLYNDTLTDVMYFTRDNYFRILSTYMEPSYYACFLVGAFYYFILTGKKTKGIYILIFLLFLQIILSFSSTAYLSFVVVGLVYFTREKNLKVKLMVIIVSIITIAILYFGFYDVLDNVIFSKSQSGSANARFAEDARALKIFDANKIIGVGYKTARASSAINTVLAEMGIIGFLNYIFVNFIVIKEIFKSEKKDISLQELGIRFAILGVFIAQIIAVPDIDICAYWMWMNILAVLISKKKKSGVVINE